MFFALVCILFEVRLIHLSQMFNGQLVIYGVFVWGKFAFILSVVEL